MEPPPLTSPAESPVVANGAAARHLDRPPRYNLLIIGGGSAGVAAALEAARWGATTALVEPRQLGGYRVTHGEVPRTALLAAARAAHQIRTSSKFGMDVESLDIEFAKVAKHVRAARQAAAARVRDELPLGLDVIEGAARFIGPDCVQVGQRTLRFHRALIATGSTSVSLEVPGLATEDRTTESSVYDWDELPRRLIVLGASAIACELAQALRRLGSEVHLVDPTETLLPGELPDATQFVRGQFEREGIFLHLGWTPRQVERTGAAKSLTLQRSTNRLKLIADEILVITERRPAVADLAIEAAGLRADVVGVQVDDWLRTSNHAIYAAGSVCGREHAGQADYFARIAVQNALLVRHRRAAGAALIRYTCTDPPVATIGMSPREAGASGLVIRVQRHDFDTACDERAAGSLEGFLELYTVAGADRIVGAVIVGSGARELAWLISAAVNHRLGLKKLAGLPLPASGPVAALLTLAQRLAVERRSPAVDRWLNKWQAWRRS